MMHILLGEKDTFWSIIMPLFLVSALLACIMLKFFPSKLIDQMKQIYFGLMQERAESALRADSSSNRGTRRKANAPQDSASKTEKLQAFIKEEVLVGIYNVCIIPFPAFVGFIML